QISAEQELSDCLPLENQACPFRALRQSCRRGPHISPADEYLIQRCRLQPFLRGWLTIVSLFLPLEMSGLQSVLAAQSPSPSRPIQQLIDGARKESQLNLFLVTSLTERGARDLNQAF